MSAPLTFHDWLRRDQPLLAGEVLPESFRLVRDGMELAWDAALGSAVAYVPKEDYPRAHEAIAGLMVEPKA